VWWDTELYGGEDFHDVILQALDDAKAAIVIWSESSVKSYWVRGEAQHAQSQRKLIPTKFAALPESDIPLNFRALHTEALADTDAFYAPLKGWRARRVISVSQKRTSRLPARLAG
jgi:TIR domain